MGFGVIWSNGMRTTIVHGRGTALGRGIVRNTGFSRCQRVRDRRTECGAGSARAVALPQYAADRERGVLPGEVRGRPAEAGAGHPVPQSGAAGRIHHPPDHHPGQRGSLLPERQPACDPGVVRVRLTAPRPRAKAPAPPTASRFACIGGAGFSLPTPAGGSYSAIEPAISRQRLAAGPLPSTREWLRECSPMALPRWLLATNSQAAPDSTHCSLLPFERAPPDTSRSEER